MGGRSLLHRVERLIPCSAPVIILSFLPYPVPCLWQAWSLICKPRSKRPILNYDVYTLIRGCKVVEETLQLIPPTANLVRKSLFNLGSPSYRNLLKTHISLLESSCYFQHSTWYGPGAQQPVGSLTFESRCNLQKYPSSSFYSNCFPKMIYQPSPRVLKSTARHRVDV